MRIAVRADRTTELEPIDPETAVELYLADREAELASETHYTHGCRLGFFADWCRDRGIDNPNELTGRNLKEYRLWRRNDGDLAPASENCQMDTLRVFVRWLESIDGAPQGLHEVVRSPAVGREEGNRDVLLESDEAETVLSYLETYHYASPEHVTLALLWRTMLRCGAAHGLDVEDYRQEDQCLQIVHRSEMDTPIENGKRGERLLALSGWMCNLLDDWIRERRHDVEDEYGRRRPGERQLGRAGEALRPADGPREDGAAPAVPRGYLRRKPSSRQSRNIFAYDARSCVACEKVRASRSTSRSRRSGCFDTSRWATCCTTW